MNQTKKSLASGLFVLTALFAFSSHSAIVLTNFGTDAITDDTTWTYNSATSNISGTQSIGNLLYNNNNTVWDLSGVAADVSLLQISLTGFVTTNPTGQFYITLIDSGSREANWAFGWGDFGSTPTTVVKNLTTSNNPSFDLSDIVNWNLSSGGSNLSVNATFSSMSAVPEPSTGALMVIGAVGLVALRRLRKV